MPSNLIGTPIAPGDYDNDGFSPGSTILLKVPGLDSPAALQQTGAAPINHIGRYAEPDRRSSSSTPPPGSGTRSGSRSTPT